jgi:hypothetical protein
MTRTANITRRIWPVGTRIDAHSPPKFSLTPPDPAAADVEHIL